MTDLTDMPPAAPAPAWLGQSTAVEQSRAVAEVQGAIIVAQRVPRRLDTARAMMRESCTMTGLAERAFYSFPRGGQQLTGPSVQLARELARCWGNVQYGITELRRDDDNGLSEMMAMAWDVQTNTRASTTFIVPHMRDRTGGPVKLRELRDVYENNANQGSRRLREQIFAILPAWFTEEAVDMCRATLNKGDGTDIATRITNAVEAYAGIGVTVDQLEQKLGRARARWTVYDLTQLMITYRSLAANELAIDEAFPPMRVTAAEIAEQAAVPLAHSSGRQPTAKQLTAVNTLLGTKLGVSGDARFERLTDVLDRPITSTKDLTFDEAGMLIDQLGDMPDFVEPDRGEPGA